MKSNRGLFDPSKGLWFRDESFIGQTTPTGRKVFWSRGNGWLFAGLARMLEQLPPEHPDRPEYQTMLQTMAAVLLPLQGADGFWRSSLLDSAQFPNPETSGTAFFTFGMVWGINAGILNRATYELAVVDAWNAMSGGLAPLSADAGPDETRLDAGRRHESGFSLDASATVVRTGSADSYTW
jgi:rhamnogalacturonyl hydrolase YesR